MKNATIKVQTASQKVLLDTELLGQFSDGYWENSRNQSWRYLNSVEVVNNPNKTGVYFSDYVPYDYKGYSVNNKTLLEVVGDRMLSKARYANSLGTTIIGEGIELILDSDNIIKKVMNNEVITLEDIEEIIQDNLLREEFWVKRAKLAIQEIKENGGIQKLLEALNDTSYNMKEMRKDLREITTILKDAKKETL